MANLNRIKTEAMKKPLLLILTSIICFAGCKKEDPEQVADGFEMAVTPSNQSRFFRAHAVAGYPNSLLDYFEERNLIFSAYWYFCTKCACYPCYG